MRKLQIGDKIKWDGSETVYTIRDIDLGRSDQLHLEWNSDDVSFYPDGRVSTWGYDYECTNEYIKMGQLILINSWFTKHIKRHEFGTV